MKQSEKNELMDQILNHASFITYHGETLSGMVVNVECVKSIVDSFPVDKEEIKEVYAVKDLITGEVFWNAHGCPYKDKNDVEKKIKKLMMPYSVNGDKLFKIITFKLDESR
jgi:hypothetical protein